MIGSGGTLLLAMRELKSLGARQIICIVSLRSSMGRLAKISNKPTMKGCSTASSAPMPSTHDKSDDRQGIGSSKPM
jgi:phosphoribosylpyrophosphate synthetase